MQPSPQHNHRKNYTVVLQSRVVRAPQNSKNGIKQRHLNNIQNIYSHPPPRRTQTSTTVLSKNTYSHNFSPQAQSHNQFHESDLLVRFGIDTLFGRVVTRVLVFLMLSQPVYVAMGMELEGEQNVVSEDISETVEVTDSESIVDDSETVTENEQSDLIASALEFGLSVSEENIEVDSQTEATDTVVANENAFEDTFSTETISEDENSINESAVEEDTSVTESDTNTETEGATDSQNTEEIDETEGDSSDIEDDASTGDTDLTDNDIAEEENYSTEDEDTTEEETVSGGGSGSTDEVDEEESTEEIDNENTTEEETENTEEEGDEETDTEILPSTATTTTATTTDAVETEPAIISQNPSSKYVFGEGDCTLVSDGEFYCVASGPERQLATGDVRVYSEKDREGDTEIFYFDGIEVRRITNNSYDDFAPVFDEETKRIVWQAMLNDRLQIMVHEIPTNTTRQITTTRQNSSNPSIAGDTVVWQEWVDTNWEIMMTDVNNNGQEFEIERLTDNAVHDMFPTAYDDLVTWQSEHGSSWEVVVYDVRTGKKHALEKSEDTKYENPRFVLLFDSKHENGDVETIGYDLDTGEMMELGTKGKQIPVIPATPKDETPEALPREATSTPQLKVIRDDDSGAGDGEGML